MLVVLQSHSAFEDRVQADDRGRGYEEVNELLREIGWSHLADLEHCAVVRIGERWYISKPYKFGRGVERYRRRTTQTSSRSPLLLGHHEG
jgi:hypothetical protein